MTEMEKNYIDQIEKMNTEHRNKIFELERDRDSLKAELD